MPTLQTYTIGTDASRDYDSLDSWEADIGVGISSDLVSDDENWVVDCYNDDGNAIDTEPITITATTDSTRNIVIKAASGNGAGGDPNDHTTRGDVQLINDASLGVQFSMNNTFSAIINTGTSSLYAEWRNLQFESTGNRARVVDSSNTWAGTWQNCIFHSTNSNGGGSTINTSSGDALVIENLLAICNSDDRDGISSFNAGDITFTSNTVVNTNSSVTGRLGIDDTGGGGTFTVEGTCIFGYPTSTDAASGDYNASDDAATPGANSLDNLTDTDQFENVAAGSSGDWRSKSGAGIVGVSGASGSTTTTDIYGTTRAASPTLGCHEFVAAVTGGHPQFYRRMMTA